jgi:hypothetical protein
MVCYYDASDLPAQLSAERADKADPADKAEQLLVGFCRDFDNPQILGA